MYFPGSRVLGPEQADEPGQLLVSQRRHRIDNAAYPLSAVLVIGYCGHVRVPASAG
jgi:hypothetical protein